VLNQAPTDPRIGKTVTQYEILAKLGGGGMGVVYRARDTKLGRFVALKFLPPQWSHDESAKQRFVREAQAASATEHRNICTIHNIEQTDDGQLFIVMTYYEGRTLKQKLEAGPLPVDEALDIAGQIAEGLAKAHARGVVHRDIKPGNVMITEDGVKILDFGLATFADALKLTIAGSTVGTVAYMSPEQVRCEDTDARSDIWALGVVLYEMLDGVLPFKGPYPEATFYAIKNEPPPPLRGAGHGIPEAVDKLVRRALEKNPEHRIQSARELARELRLLQGRTVPLELRTEPLPPVLAARPAAASVGRRLIRGALEAIRDMRAGRPVPPRQAHRPPAASIAVLPFRDMSPGKDQDCFCEGLTEELISALTKIRGLRVAARTSAFQFKDQDRDLRHIGETLNVATVLDGSVRKTGNRLRITIELLNSADGYHLWSERFDRDLEDVFAVQDEIASTVVRILKGKLVTDEGTTVVAPHTSNLEAYLSYLEGRYHWNKRTEHELKKSLGCFEQAIARDPGYVQAYVGLADAYVTLGTYGALPANDVMPRAKTALRRALDLDPERAEAYACRGCVQSVYDWAWLAAEHDFKRAIHLNPGYPIAHHWYAINYLVPVGRFDEAAEQLRQALELDPLSLAIKTSVGMRSYFAGRYEPALQELSKAVELDASFGLARVFLGLTYTALAKWDEAFEELDVAIALSGRNPDVLAALGYLRAVAGDIDGARTILAELGGISQRRYVSPSVLAQVHAGLGDTAEALHWLEEACAARAADLAWLAVRPVFSSLRAEPRFVALLRRMGLAADSRS
jgi:serine/threonine-protein kinase